MRLAVLAVVLGASISAVQASQSGDPSGRSAQVPSPSTESIAGAYDQFLLAQELESDDKPDEAVAAYKRAMALDPGAGSIPAELAGLYLRQRKTQDALALGEQALALDPDNREAHRVVGMAYASLVGGPPGTRPSTSVAKTDPNVAQAIKHLEAAMAHVVGDADPSVGATLARLYGRAGAYDKAIALLTDLMNQQPGWQNGALLLAQMLSDAGRNAEAVAYLEQAATANPALYPSLADAYERAHRWSDAADAYGKAIERSPRNLEWKTRLARVLYNKGDYASLAKARTALGEVLTAAPNDEQALYLMSQVQRRLGNFDGAETSARRIIAQNSKSPWGYHALAQALEGRRRYQAVIDDLRDVVTEFRSAPAGDAEFELALLLPDLGFAYQELGAYDKAIAAFEEARKISPDDAGAAGNLVAANIAGKRYSRAVELAQQARARYPDDLRLAALQAQALRQSGKVEQGLTLLEGVVRTHVDDPAAYITLGRLYLDADRQPQAIKLLQEAQQKFPGNTSIAFELGAAFDHGSRFVDAEAAFRSVLAREPDNAAALNYLGYMLAERGERLDESVTYLKKALELEPDNGSYLDSLGWAYFKSDRLDLAEENLKRAADQLQANSVVQDHYGELLFKLGRYQDAIAAWTRALNGDGEEVNRSALDRKIRLARQKIDK
jgi:tetratricopeptide (TPR) repeat protein